MTTHQLTIDADRHVIEPVDLWRRAMATARSVVGR
jgi:hypothetical protein